MTLTDAQARILSEVRATGPRTYTGRAAKAIKALEAAGLVTVDWDMRAQSKGGGMELVHKITVTARAEPTDAPRDEVAVSALRLAVTRSNFAAAIRGCQLAGMTPKTIGEVVGLKATDVRVLINAWGL